MASDRIFHFSSLAHSGCRIFVLGQTITDIEVAVVRDYELIRDGAKTHRVNGGTRVYGKLHGYEPEFAPTTVWEPTPFDIEVHAYDPINSKDCIMAVFRAYVVDVTTGEFTAISVRPWYAINERKPSTIPYLWHDVNIAQPFVPEDNLVGKIKSWKKENKQYQHIDKSVPPRIYHTGSIQTGSTQKYEASPWYWLSCSRCGHDYDVSGMCKTCSHVASRLPEESETDDTVAALHIGPWTCVRACIDCGVLVTGGPTRCAYCAKQMEQKEHDA